MKNAKFIGHVCVCLSVCIKGTLFKDKDYCPLEIIKGLTDKGQFQKLTKL